MSAVLALLLAAAVQTGAPPAEVVSAAPDSVTITLYREAGLSSRELQENPDAASLGLVMVTETRTVDVPTGEGRIAFRGVADGMIPQTAAVSGLEGMVAEQNFDYDLLTPGALAARSVGETVRLVRTNPGNGRVTEERAVIRSAPLGVVLDIGGRTEALDCSGLPERLVFERVPEGLADRPTLSVRTRIAQGGRRTLRLSYLATGLAWSADYVLRLNPDGRTADLTGWLTLANSGDTTFGRVPTSVVAGTLAREEVERIEATLLTRKQRCWPRPVRWPTMERREFEGPVQARVPPPPPPPMYAPAPEEATEIYEIVVTGSRVAKQSELGDYKLYTLPEPTTVAARQVKQVRFLEKRAVPVARVYEHRLDAEPDGDDDPAFPAVLLRAANTEAGRLGAPLPAGNVVVLEPGRAGAPTYVGEDGLEDTPIGLPVEVEVGDATDVAVQERLLDESRQGRGRVRRAYEAVLTNAKPHGVRVELRFPALDGLRVVREDGRHVRKDGAPLWAIDLKPGERRVFRYTVESDG